MDHHLEISTWLRDGNGWKATRYGWERIGHAQLTIADTGHQMSGGSMSSGLGSVSFAGYNSETPPQKRKEENPVKLFEVELKPSFTGGPTSHLSVQTRIPRKRRSWTRLSLIGARN
ncbi:hypothetical protein RIF29_33362 [Crotalaria pallida]|uniref:Uncharacterized protein n=1 Tax=Crotalaria pallida TaxID=3830 RepID=A0AAN9E7Q1_CROPI